ncbi:hypothetical protein VN1264_11870 [Helicobacter pylori]|nr:hypothetical protein VN1264_11870 [Helicobacter pylori]
MKLPKALNEATAGAALKYHIKRALERSHSISEFSKNLELSAQKSHFSNNTLKIIEELTNGVKQASDELKEKAFDFSNEKLTNEQIKELLNNAKIPTSGRDAITFGTNNLNPEMVEFLHKNNKKMIIEKASNKELELLADANFRHPENIRASLDHDAIAHILKRHGVDSVNVRNGENPITYDDIANYRYIVNNADAILRTIDKYNKEAITAFKQVNGYAVVVEQAINKKNELVLKTMYKSNGSYKNNDTYKEFSSTSLNANAKVPYKLSSYSGATENTTKNPLTSQEDLLKTQENPQKTQDLSPLELANAEKLAKLESERLESEKEFSRLKEQEQARKEALKKKLEHERGNAGNIESATKIEVGEDIPVQALAQIPKSRVRLNEREIYDLNYAIVKAKDLKPSFTTGGTQKRTDMNEEQIKSIAQNFDPKKIFGSGGFEDLPIILHDGQVIAGNHRVQGMLNFTPKSRYIYEKAIKEYYHIDLKPDELLVRLPSKRLNNTEINNLAASSNQGRFNSESDHAIAVLSHYEPKLKELESKLNADSVYSLKNIVAKNLNFDKATHPNAGDSNLALLMFNMPRTKTQGIELLNRWQKEFSNDIKSYEKVKKMFVDNAGSFHNLIHDMNFPNVSLNAYLSDIMDRSFANLKNYQTTSESLKDLSEKFYKTNSLEMFEKSDQSVSDISEILGGAIARFARFDDPSKALFEALKSDNIKKGLKEFKIADVTKDMFNPDSKEFKDIDIYDFTHYLLMVGREPNENNPTLKRLIQAVKDMQKENEKGIKGQKLETPSEWGNNYSEFKGDGLGAINKLLETKKGFVAGAFHKEGLGDIDLVWGNKDYGLEHILKRRIETYIKKGFKPKFAEQRALNLVRMMPEVIEKGKVGRDAQGRLKIETKDILVALRDNWQGEPLKSKWVITGFEKKVGNIREQAKFIDPSLITKDGEHLASSLNSVEPNPTQKPLTDQEDLLKNTELDNETTKEATKLSPLEQAKAEKLAKLEREQEQSEQEFLKAKEQEIKRKEALKKKLEHERGNAGNIESQTKIEVGEDIPTEIQAQIPKSRVRLNEREIYDLDYAIVKAKDLKPSFTIGGTQKRTDMNEEQIKSIAENFDPKKIFGSGGFEDLPIILNDGQVIAGNHRIQGMLNFTPKSRYIYHKAIQEYYNIDLKPDELLVRLPSKRLNNTEINNLAASSNQGRFNSESDHAIAVLSHYEAKLKELDQKLDADSIYSLKNIVAKNLNFDKATHPNVGDSNLALLMYNMPRTKTQGIELLNRWQKEFSNDIKSYEKVKKMFVDNAGSFHNLIHDMNFPNVSLNAYLSDIMDRSFANLKNYQSTSESLKDLSEKFYKTSSLEMFEKSDQTTSDISEILGGAIARFARFDDPSKALFEALKSDNIKKGLKDYKIADATKDMFNPDSKEFKDIDIYDFTHYLLMVNREPNENNPVLNRLIQAVKDRQKESEKGIKEASKTNAEETKKGIKKQKLETPSEWGYNYSEFKGDGLGAINKLLETKKGFVAGAFYKEGLGDIDLVWGTPKTKDSDGYGLAHILERRISNEMKKGLSETEAKEYASNIVKSIPEVLEKGTKGTDHLGRVFVDYGNKRVGLNNEWKKEKLENHWVISSYELYDTEKQALRSTPQAITKEKAFNSLNSDEPNPNIKK